MVRKMMVSLTVAFCCLPALVTAQKQSVSRVVTRAPDIAEAVRARPAPPLIDGVLDDDAWQDAPVFSDFIQRDPDEGEPATERTEFRVVYSNDALYVAVRSFDRQPDDIAAILARRDEWSPSDEVMIMVDSYLDRRTGFTFAVNAAGVKRDAYLFDDSNEDDRYCRQTWYER